MKSLIYPQRKQTITLARSGRDEWRKLELGRQCERKETEKEKNAQCKATRDQGGERRTQLGVAMEILRWKKARTRLTTRDGKDRDLRKRDPEETAVAKDLEV